MTTSKVTYKVRTYGEMFFEFSTWEKALTHAQNNNQEFIKVCCKGFEKVVSIDTWKNAKQIKFDILCETF
jgi:hypothetical protein